MMEPECKDSACVVCATGLTMGRVIPTSRSMDPAEKRVPFPSLSLMHRGEPVVRLGGACYCDGACDRGERCTAWPQGKPTQATLPGDSNGRGLRRALENLRLPTAPLPWPDGYPRPLIRPVGGGKYRCFIHGARTAHLEGFGDSPVRAWNACVTHIKR